MRGDRAVAERGVRLRLGLVELGERGVGRMVAERIGACLHCGAMPSPARRAIDAVRGAALKARRVLARADAIELARRVAVGDRRRAGARARRGTSRSTLGAGTVLGREALAPPCARATPSASIVGRFASIAHGVEFHAAARTAASGSRSSRCARGSTCPAPTSDGFPHGRGDILRRPRRLDRARAAIVMSGVTIGPGAVVATRSVVTEDVAPVRDRRRRAGEAIGQRFSDEQIAALLRIAWWDWPLETIKARVDELCSPDVDAFIAAYDPGPPIAPTA